MGRQIELRTLILLSDDQASHSVISMKTLTRFNWALFLLNAGRFDRELRFQLPTRDSRKEILKVHTRDWKPSVPEALVSFL